MVGERLKVSRVDVIAEKFKALGRAEQPQPPYCSIMSPQKTG